MASFLGCKLLSVITLLLGLCINGKIRVSFTIDLETENVESKISFRRILLDGLKKQKNKNTYKELDDRTKQVFCDFIDDEEIFFNDLKKEYVNSKGLENGEEKNAIENSISLDKNTDNFMVNVAFESENNGSIEKKEKKFKLTLIDFPEIDLNDLKYDEEGNLDGSIIWHYRKFEKKNTHELFLEGSDSEIYSRVDKYLTTYDSISLVSSAHGIEVTFHTSFERRVLIL